MSDLVVIALLSLVLWLSIKIFWLELPSLRVVIAMRKLKGPNGLPLFLGVAINFLTMAYEDLFDYYENLGKLYPRITAMYTAGVPCVVLHKPQDIKHVLASNVNINKGKEYGPLLPWLKEGLLLSHGSKWHLRRKLLSPSFHFQFLENSFDGIIKNSKILANKLLETRGAKISIHDYITRCTLDVITETAMGVQLKTQTEQENSYLQCVIKASELVMYRVASIYMLNDNLFALSRARSQFTTVLKTLHNFTDKVIAVRKRSNNFNQHLKMNTLTGKSKMAFLDTLLTLQQCNPDTFNDQDIREEVDTFMFEGHDTTSAALSFAIWVLGSHPDVQEKAYEEIQQIVGDGEINMKDVSNMNYLERVVKETLRLYPSVPYISRRLSEDVCLDDGTILPATANVIIIPYLLHQDPNSFTDPKRFDPERFTEEAMRGKQPYSYIPFSAGPRNCIGQKFAMLELKATIASVLRQCRIESITKRQDFKILPHVIIKPSCPLECRFLPRN